MFVAGISLHDCSVFVYLLLLRCFVDVCVAQDEYLQKFLDGCLGDKIDDQTDDYTKLKLKNEIIVTFLAVLLRSAHGTGAKLTRQLLRMLRCSEPGGRALDGGTKSDDVCGYLMKMDVLGAITLHSVIAGIRMVE